MNPVWIAMMSIAAYKHRMKLLAQVLKNINRMIFACDISYYAEIGSNLKLPHSGLGVVIGPRVILGDNVKICQNVTLGTKIGGVEYKVPKIGNNVLIGAGAVCLGDIYIGNNVRIGANSVVLQDIPDNCVAVGVPAKVIKNINEEKM